MKNSAGKVKDRGGESTGRPEVLAVNANVERISGDPKFAPLAKLPGERDDPRVTLGKETWVWPERKKLLKPTSNRRGRTLRRLTDIRH